MLGFGAKRNCGMDSRDPTPRPRWGWHCCPSRPAELGTESRALAPSSSDAGPAKACPRSPRHLLSTQKFSLPCIKLQAEWGSLPRRKPSGCCPCPTQGEEEAPFSRSLFAGPILHLKLCCKTPELFSASGEVHDFPRPWRPRDKGTVIVHVLKYGT